MKRIHVLFMGRVQGVGFRFTAESIALKYSIKGWVKNLPNGDVELVGESSEDNLHKLLNDIDSSSVGKYITKKKVDWQKAEGEFSDFRIEFVY